MYNTTNLLVDTNRPKTTYKAEILLLMGRIYLPSQIPLHHPRMK